MTTATPRMEELLARYAVLMLAKECGGRLFGQNAWNITFNQDAWDKFAAYLAAKPAEQNSSPDDIRALGWTVAVHNDYRQLGEPHTFWLFTKDGRAVKGEGMSDAEALNKVRAALSTTGAPKP